MNILFYEKNENTSREGSKNNPCYILFKLGLKADASLLTRKHKTRTIIERT
jgi:hypothetical protein